jgi:GT2 family glycosyltransferase
MGTKNIDIIIPVYRQLELTRQCVESVLSAPDAAMGTIHLINDASPEPELADYCREVAINDRIQLLEHADNQGFVFSVNEGLRAAGDRDVVILNSDTEVPLGWLSRLKLAAHANPNAASITPFSNNATICSYPDFCRENELPRDLGGREVDQMFAKANEGVSIEVPTGVGFCMFLRRAAIDEVGGFDEEAFGRGYGEENDWCLKASAKGWKHYLCADVYVYHAGGASFGAEAETLQASAMAVIASRYPDYERQIANFIEADPIEPARHAVDLVRPDTTAVLSESRARERAERACRYELDRQRHDQVTRLDELLVTTRDAAKAEAGQYESILQSVRAEAAAREAQYQAQVDEMAAGYAALNTEHQRLTRFWVVRIWSGLMRRLGH